MATLQIESRPKTSSAGTRRLLNDGILPMALISKKDGTKLIQAVRSDVKTIFDAMSGVAIFDVEDSGNKSRVILKDVQRDPASRRVIHMTVMEVAMDDVVKVSVPVHVEGTPESVAKKISTLMVPTTQLDVQARVKDLPETIVVDVSKLGENDKIADGDLNLGDGVSFLTSDATVIATTKQLRSMASAEAEEGEEGAEGEGAEGEEAGEGAEEAAEEGDSE